LSCLAFAPLVPLLFAVSCCSLSVPFPLFFSVPLLFNTLPCFLNELCVKSGASQASRRTPRRVALSVSKNLGVFASLRDYFLFSIHVSPSAFSAAPRESSVQVAAPPGASACELGPRCPHRRY
jgi:hypothetical protein